MSQEQPTPEPAQAAQAMTPNIAERGVLVKGQRIAAAMSDAPRALLARVPLVVLPDAGFTWEDYRLILNRFAPERRVFALDWPGFGHSAKPAPADFSYSTASYADVLADWLDTLGIARSVLLGNGFGAAAAIRYAATKPQRVVGLALVAPTGFTPPGRTRPLAGRLLGMPGLLRRFAPWLASLALGPATQETQAILARQRATHERDAAEYAATLAAYAALWHGLNTPAEGLTSLAPQVRAPTIVLRGALDPIITSSETRCAAEMLGEGHALEVILPDAGHLPFLQQPQRFYQAIEGILGTAEVNAITTA